MGFFMPKILKVRAVLVIWNSDVDTILWQVYFVENGRPSTMGNGFDRDFHLLFTSFSNLDIWF